MIRRARSLRLRPAPTEDRGCSAEELAPDMAFTRWMVYECGPRDLDGEAIEWGSVPESEQFFRRGGIFSDYQLVGLVPRLPPSFSWTLRPGVPL